jgi:prevent-host-death family protein
MHVTNIYQAKTNLSKLVQLAIQGQEIIISKAGNPVAKLIPYVEQPTKRKAGSFKNKIWISDDFDQENSQINQMFYGKD